TLNEVRQLVAGIQRAYYEIFQFRLVRLAADVSAKQPPGLFHSFGIVERQAETSAVFDIKVRVVERQKVENPAIDDHELVGMAAKIVGGSGNLDSPREQLRFQLAQVLLLAVIRICDERVDGDAAFHGSSKRLLHLLMVKTEDGDLDTLFRVIDLFDERR